MATPVSPDQRKENFTCSTCAKPYDNDGHEAKILPCLHTSCLSCLQHRQSKEQEKLSCFKCGTVVTQQGKTVDSLPNNFTVDNLKMYHDILNSTVSCGNCFDDGNNAVSFCHDCHCFLCQICLEAHKRMGALRSHKLSPMAELHERKFNPIRELYMQKCDKHLEQNLVQFCKDCKVAICSTCALVDHHGHASVNLTAIADEIAEALKQTSAKVEKIKCELSRKQEATDAIKKTLTANFTAKKERHKRVQAKNN